MSIASSGRVEKRVIKREIQRNRNSRLVRRLTALHMILCGRQVIEISHLLCAARSSIYRWQGWYGERGITGLYRKLPGRKAVLPYRLMRNLIKRLLQTTPRTLGYLRSRWSSELFAAVLNERLELQVHASTIRRLLRNMGIHYRRARPTLCIRDPKKDEKMALIQKALKDESRDTATFYVDEVDVDFNPKIGFSWQTKGKQETIPTPGKNQKHYLAGAQHSRTGNLVYVESTRKNSELFISLLQAISKRYRYAKQINIILDNYIIHKSRKTLKWLERNPRIKLIFQPVYSPWVNRIERLWKQLHDTVTRNHREKSMENLLGNVRTFMTCASPFPGNHHGLAKVC